MGLPRKIDQERLPRDGVRYRLPNRGTEEMRMIGLLTVAVILGINAFIDARTAPHCGCAG